MSYATCPMSHNRCSNHSHPITAIPMTTQQTPNRSTSATRSPGGRATSASRCTRPCAGWARRAPAGAYAEWCVHARMCICVCGCAYVQVCEGLNSCVYVCVFAFVCVHQMGETGPGKCAQSGVCMRVCVFVCVDVHMYRCVCLNSCVYVPDGQVGPRKVSEKES